MILLCPCGKDKNFEHCCGRFLSGKAIAKTPEQLMRSRYSAYSLGHYGEYLLNTWQPAMVGNLTAESLSEKSCEWLKLEILDTSQKGDEGAVEFKAYYLGPDNIKEVMHEKSSFQRISGKWLYVGAIK